VNCSLAKSLLSPYLDGAITGTEMQALSQHLKECAPCTQRYLSLSQTQQLLAQAGRRKAPPDLALKLRVAVSREIARSRRPIFEGLQIRLENVLRAFMVPVTAGLATAVLIFGVLIGTLVQPLQADNSDVPLMMVTAPQLQQAALTPMDSIHDDSLVIEAYVGSDGRVQDYRIISDPSDSKQVMPQVKNMMLDMMVFARFRPATSMGKPTPGRAVLAFSRISVRG
jgi:Putative zinc-finger